MQYIGHTKPKMLIADEGKRLIAIITDGNGEKVLDENDKNKNKTTAFLPDSISEEQAKEMFVEEDKIEEE